MPTTFLVPENRAASTLDGDITSGALSLSVDTGGGAEFPSTYPYHITIDDEILSVSNRSSDTFTVARGEEDTTPSVHTNAAAVRMHITAQAISDLNTGVNNIETGTTTLDSVTTSGSVTVGTDLAVNGSNVTSDNATVNIMNVTPTTVNLGGAADVNLSAVGKVATAAGDLAVNGGNITSPAATANIVNATPTTVNLGGVADVNVGGASKIVTVPGELAADGGSLTTNKTTFALVDDTATTVDIAGAATAITIGAATGTTTINNNAIVAGYLSSLNFTNSQHYTGFPNQIDTSIGWDDGTATFTLTASADNIWIDGVEYEIDTLTQQLPSGQAAPSGTYWFWITAPGGVPQLNTSVTAPGFGVCLTAAVYWNTTTNEGSLNCERHWFGRDKWWHESHHETVGAQYASGMAGTFLDATFEIEAGEFYDEDIEHVNSTETVASVFYHNGDNDWAFDTATTTPYKEVNSNLAFNAGTTLTEAAANRYVNYFVFITGDLVDPAHIIIGTAEYTTLAAARAAGVPSLGDLPGPENKLIYKLIYINSGTIAFVEAFDFRTVSTIPNQGVTPTDHGGLAGLAGDDHPGYLWGLGRAGGQELFGSDTTAEDLTLTDNSVDNNSITVTQAITAYNERREWDGAATNLVVDTGLASLGFPVPTVPDDGKVISVNGSGDYTLTSPVGSFDPTQPGPIGGTAPSSGDFTTLSSTLNTTVGGQIIAGSGTHTLTNVAGLLAGSKIQGATVDTAALAPNAVDATILDEAGSYTVVAIITTGDGTIGGQIIAGSGVHTLTDATGLIDGGKLQTGTVTGLKIDLGSVDHGGLGGRTDDDHAGYLWGLGRVGGQTLLGGTGTTDSLVLQATSGVGASGSSIDMLVGDDGDIQAVTILQDGKVGIGPTPPIAPLYVSGTGDLPVYITTTSVTATDRVSLVLEHGSRSWIVQNDPNVALFKIHDFTAGLNRLTIDYSGNVDVVGGDLWVFGDVSAATFTDRSPHFSGDALGLLGNIKAELGPVDQDGLSKVDHTTLGILNTKQIRKKYRNRLDSQDIIESNAVNQRYRVAYPEPLDDKRENAREDAWVADNFEPCDVEEDGRNLGLQIQVNSRASVQLNSRVETLEATITGLLARIDALEAAK